VLEDEVKALGAVDGAIGVDADAEPASRYMLCVVDQKGIHPQTPYDDQENAIGAAMSLSQGGPTVCIVEEAMLATVDKGDGIVAAFRQGKPFPLRENIIRAQQEAEELIERRRRLAEKRREAEAKKKRADQILYGTVAGFCGIVITLVILQIFL
jgi:hypothetical protein